MSEKVTSLSRGLRVIKAMSGHTLDGVSNGELAKALNESPSAITRTLQTLIEEGFAIKLDNGRFALSIQMLQIATRHTTEFERAAQRMAELNQRINTGNS
ncbi:Transcriptional regulator, IclR family [Methylophaga frappieri]|uniref:Transcriptional regulator, IclR family n=1 Tax=Methylophaga frappieri (strain ATCC BAA-2434 / DSM 25690 / JAM7) TaxID=754477 RepID=I1YGE3_METFJ|nr:helix-turn-helix domain-containing protein [Methylophaga frappieri]AFJ01986.1 Transcriptional regulator, IclR family [Methylophaga frappieri]